MKLFYGEIKSIFSYRFDGIEYRFMHDITRNWLVRYQIVDVGWNGVLDTLSNDTSDIALCSVYLSFDHIQRFDLSSYFDHLCLTLFVPRPKQITEALFIYLSLPFDVWICYVGIFIIVGLFLYAISRLGAHLRIFDEKKVIYSNLQRSYIDVINVATSHGVTQFPFQAPLKIVIVR